MEAFFASGQAALVVLAALALEGGWLVWRGHGVGEVALLLLPGALIVLALHGALVGAHWQWIALPLALAFPAHLADLARRLRRRLQRP